jgi:hypothetical protein
LRDGVAPWVLLALQQIGVVIEATGKPPKGLGFGVAETLGAFAHVKRNGS